MKPSMWTICRAGVGLVLVGLVLGGCGRQKMTPEAVVLLEAGMVAYEMDDPAVASQKMDAFLVEYPRTDRVDEAYYYRGLARLETGDVEGARQDFEMVLTTARDVDRRAVTLALLGDIAVSDGDMTTGEARYRQALDDFRRDVRPRDEVLFKLGTLLQREGRFAESDLFYNQLVGDFPGTALSREAEGRVHCDHWTLWVATCRTQAEARLVAQAAGGEATIRPARREGELVFHVRVGSVPTYVEGVVLRETYFDQFPAAKLIVAR
jgi:tetratricopeptide (TPR) repeat protein